MALPKINEHLKFTMEIPSTGKKVKYRPYLVKEEKVLLQAFESRDMKTCLEAMCDTLQHCISDKDNIKVSELPTFDLEYMFLKVRSKSVGETSELHIKCNECSEENPYFLDLDKVKLDYEPKSNVFAITKDIKIEMKYPNYHMISKMEISQEDESSEGEMESAIEMLSECLVAVHTEDERIDCSQQTKEEIITFISSMTSEQMKLVSDYLNKMPTLEHAINFKCKKCEADNEINLKGLADFF